MGAGGSSAASPGRRFSGAAVLVHRAVGDQLTCVFVDHGLLRKGEPEQVVKTFRDAASGSMMSTPMDHRRRFMGRMAGVVDPETKRKIIGEEFIRVFEDQAAKLGGCPLPGPGDLYPDVIESGGEAATAATIKTHHNVGGLPEDLEFELVEPLRILFKDEVRALARELGLPEGIVWRQPFPGPGLGDPIVMAK